MPKVSSARLFVLAQEFKQDSIETDGTVIRCTICDSGILLDEKHQRDRIKQHISSSKHKKTRLFKQINCDNLYYEIYLNSVLQKFKI